MLMVKCRECGSLSDSLAPSCPYCGALRPGVRFDSAASSSQRAFVAIRNGLLFRVLTPRNLLVGAVLVVLGLIVYRATRPTPEEVAARAREAAATAVASRDSSVISSMKRDLREAMTAEEMYFAGMHIYGSFDQLKKEGFALSAGNTMAIRATNTGYFITVKNSTLPSGTAECALQVAGGASTSVDGVIVCRGGPKEQRPKP
jgi:hypothetical protein